MTRRQTHQTIAIGGTVVFLVGCLDWAMTGRQFTVFLTICGAYVGFLLVLFLVCWLNVPVALRRRPEMPQEFQVFRLGTLTPEGLAMLNRLPLIEEGLFKDGPHRHFQMDHVFPEGLWRCQVEEVSGRVIAYSVSFKSASSPVLDAGEEHGTGRFVATPGQS